MQSLRLDDSNGRVSRQKSPGHRALRLERASGTDHLQVGNRCDFRGHGLWTLVLLGHKDTMSKENILDCPQIA
ncbi:hypothetical protein CesoFtcFv8_019568 [Champsocephalus esox]|uniref:Uncharacterized protein n=1 Tax=Champsocephalus esox TaxID=159716 RepID=A0AAN8BE01_9TELE|nr:hypothetical protein CesoFtcFv8_019568 [Champsocephalus esox]